MTEAEWLACTDPEWMLLSVQGRTADRKFRLFGCGCCRRMWHLSAGEMDRSAIELAERFADGQATPDAVERFRQQTDWAKPGAAKYTVYANAFSAAHSVLRGVIQSLIAAATSQAVKRALNEEGETADEAFQAGRRAYDVATVEAGRSERAAHVQLIRCVFGNPFRPVGVDPVWLTSDVLSLARGMYASRDFSAMPILADALQDAGCDNAEVLNHCRGDGPHVRGCWVVDLVLEKV